MAKTKTRIFQTETKQLLKLMIHSLCSKQKYLLENCINASDALDKLGLSLLKTKNYLNSIKI